ncbi:hypothetical protein J4Q44_G00388810 [Coregonus suidteri]|uniref:Uncharacterized protein n=1 Tax=Coregonus suidteri TaxID=861788 RepID=A0AAN8Q903_9TELE
MLEKKRDNLDIKEKELEERKMVVRKEMKTANQELDERKEEMDRKKKRSTENYIHNEVKQGCLNHKH